MNLIPLINFLSSDSHDVSVPLKSYYYLKTNTNFPLWTPKSYPILRIHIEMCILYVITLDTKTVKICQNQHNPHTIYRYYWRLFHWKRFVNLMAICKESCLPSESSIQFNIEDHMRCNFHVSMWTLFTFLPDIKWDAIIFRLFVHGVLPQGVPIILINLDGLIHLFWYSDTMPQSE